MTAKSQSEALAGTKAKVLDEKWGKSVVAAGYTAIPDILVRYQQRLKLKPLDINVLLHLLSYWWRSSEFPRPSKVTLATAIGVDPSTVRRCLKKLESAGYLTRVERRTPQGSRPNTYDLAGLVKALQPLASEEHEEIRKRKQKKLAKLSGKKSGLHVVK
jgi:predicted transcriptional regulator